MCGGCSAGLLLFLSAPGCVFRSCPATRWTRPSHAPGCERAHVRGSSQGGVSFSSSCEPGPDSMLPSRTSDSSTSLEDSSLRFSLFTRLGLRAASFLGRESSSQLYAELKCGQAAGNAL
ncbi:hypothetical protein AOLI_G00322210 [Acnodon oligacanthus]